MNPDLEKLKALEEADREIQRLNEEVAALPVRVTAIETKLAGVKASIESHQVAIKQTESARRKLEDDIQFQQQKISKYRDQSLEVKTNEQYKALMQEINFAESAIRAAEDKILESMVEAESHEKELQAAQAEFREQQAAVAKEKAETHARSEQDRGELVEWNTRRDSLRSGITVDVLAHYDRVRAVRKNALAEARGQNCLGCNVLLRPQTYDEVRANQQIIACDSCSRILYYDPAHEAIEEKPKPKRKRPAADPELSPAAGNAAENADEAAEPRSQPAPAVH